MKKSIKNPPTKSNILGKTALAKQINEQLKKQKHSLTNPQVEAVISQTLEEIKKALVQGQEIRFPGYLSLKTTTQKPRVAMNLQTKKKINIPAKRVPKAKFSADLKSEIAKKK